MSAEQHYRKLENLYHAAPCNQYFQPRLTIERARAEVTIEVRPDLFHAGLAVHGCVYFKAMDDASFFAANSLVEDVFVLTVQFNIHFLRPVDSGQIRALGHVVQASPVLYVAEAIAYNARGKEIGRGSGSFVRSKILLTPEIGYRER
ncbi:MAG: PaaI family thioesterase [Phycisphaerae bacterium]|nr:PaaI family thioesterase [Phycisphaerae bacterium]